MSDLDLDLERACEVMHDAYEAAALGAGWETQAASRKPWSEVPEANKATMRVAVQALIDHVIEVARVGTIEALEERGEDPDTALGDPA